MTFNNLNLSDQNSLDFFEDFDKLMTLEELPSKHVLHSEGMVCNHFYILHKGLARAYYYKDAKNITAKSQL